MEDESYLSMLSSVVQVRPRNSKLVVLVSKRAMPREMKIAHGLRANGFRVVFVTCAARAADADAFDVVHLIQNVEELVQTCSLYAPLAFHVFCSWDYEYACALLKYRPGPIVIDIYDGLSGILNPASVWMKLVPQELFCLHNGDGFCCRSLESQVPRRQGIAFGGPRIYFSDGCWNTLSESDVRFRDDGIHVVYVGNLNANAAVDSPFAVHPWLAEVLRQQGIHYHVYPTPLHFGETEIRRMMSVYRNVLSENPYFHLHDPVAPEKVCQEISQYHFGHVFLTKALHSLPCETYLESKFDRCTTNKIFDYVDAGLFTLLSPSRLIATTGERYGFGRRVDLQDLDAIGDWMRAQDPQDLRRRVAMARSRLDVAKDAARLPSFYHRVERVFREKLGLGHAPTGSDGV